MAQKKRISKKLPIESLRQRAEEMTRISPSDIAGMPNNELQRTIHELQIQQIELELQNEELRQAQVELAHSRDQYSDLYDFAPVGYVTLDSDGKIQNANLTAAAMLGVERQHLLQTSLFRFVSHESQDEFHRHWQAVLSSQTKQTCEVRMKGGEARGLSVRLESIAFGPENDRCCRTSLIDLTVKRQSQQQLKESERRFRRLTDALTDYIYRVRVEQGRAVETLHEANCEKVTGYTPEEFDANRLLWIVMVPPVDHVIVEGQVACILSGQEAAPIEHRICRKDGQVIWVLNTVSPEYDDQGRLIAYDGLIRDITQRKAAEGTLRLLNIDLGNSLADRTGELQANIKQVKLLTEAVSHLGEGVLITSSQLDWPGPRIIFVNDAMCRITGFTAEELIGQSPRVLQGNDSNRATLDRIKAELSAGRSARAEVINYRKDGTPYHAELFITPLLDAEGNRTNFVSIHRDISEQKRVENLLRQERNRAQQYLDLMGVIMVSLDACGDITLLNRKGCEVLGWDEHELLGKSWFDTCLPEGCRNDWRGVFQQILNGSVANVEYFENPVLTRTGEERIIEWHHSEIRDETGRVVGVLSSGNDTTDRREAEKELRESEARLASLFDALPVSVGIIDVEGKAVISNPAMRRYLPTGVIPSRDPDRVGRWRGAYPDGRLIDPADCASARAMRGERVVPGIEFQYVQDDGTEVWTQVAAVPLLTNAGVNGHVLVVSDIDAAKRAEKRLALQARQQADIATLGQKALFGQPLQQLMDDAVRSVSNILDNELVKVLELLPGGDRLLLRAGVGWREGLVGTATVSAKESQAGYTLLNSGPVVVADLATETRFTGPSLLIEHGVVSGISCVILGTGGEPYGVLGTHTRSRREFTPDDVAFLAGIANVLGTVIQRRLLENSRRASEERMRAILNTAADAIITIDQRGIITTVNPATEKMFGYTREELVGQNVKILMPSPYRDEHDGYLQRYLKTGEARIIGIGRELVGRRKDGSSFPISLSVSEVDHMQLFTGIIRDMSEQRKLQRDVVAIAEEEQRRIAQDLHDSTQQELAGLSLFTQTLFTMLTQGSGDRQKASLDIDKCSGLAKHILVGLGRTHKEVQSIARGLIPIRLDPEGLMEALRELASRTDELDGITCAFKCEEPVEVAESFTATHLYRIAQEAVTNALKHARPEHILIALESDNGHPTLQVADDGTGFDFSKKSEGVGLKIMQYRASLIGASLAISPVDTGGTLVTCKVFLGKGNSDDTQH